MSWVNSLTSRFGSLFELANLRLLSTVPDKKEVLNSIFSSVDKIDFSNLRMSTDMLKAPVVFPDFNLEISFSISSVVVGYIKKESQTGLCKYSVRNFSTIGIALVKLLPMLESMYYKHLPPQLGYF